MFSMNIHDCKKIVFESHYPTNGNSVSLQILSGDDERVFDLNLFNLSDSEIQKLRDGFGEPRRIVTRSDAEADLAEINGEAA